MSPPGGIIRLLAVAKFAKKHLNLGPCSTTELEDIWRELAGVIGDAYSFKERVEDKAVRRILKSAARDARNLHRLLKLETGFTDLDRSEFEARGRLIQWLRANPEFGFGEKDSITLDPTAEKILNIAQAAEAAVAEIQQTKFPGGAPPLGWYQGLASLALYICERHGLRRTLHRDVYGKPTGSLYLVAGQLERLLPPWMRSKAPETRFDRLKNAIKAINTEKGKTASNSG